MKEDAYRNYGNSDLVGKTGVELTYEKWLRGRKGVQRYVVNSDGETIRNLGEVDPTPGDNLVLTLDSDVQKSAEAALQEGMERARTIFDDDPDFNKYFEAPAGAVVVLDAKTGGVVAMASNPSYDPRWFVRGLKPQEQNYMFKSPRAPSLDRAFQQVYIPGSTFKPFTALAAVKEGVASLDGSYDVSCRVRPPRRHIGHDVQQLVVRRPRVHVDPRAPADLVRHVVLRLGVGLLLQVPEQPVRCEQRAAPA